MMQRGLASHLHRSLALTFVPYDPYDAQGSYDQPYDQPYDQREPREPSRRRYEPNARYESSFDDEPRPRSRTTTFADESDDRWRRESLRTFGRGEPREPGGPSQGKALALVGLALAALLVVIATVTIEANLIGRAGGSANGTAASASATARSSSATPAGTATTSGRTFPPTGGWAQLGPTWAQRAAFAESSPAHGYTCGVASGAQTGAIGAAATHDAGSTWQTFSTPAKGAYCDVRVSTTNSQDVALFASAICEQGNDCSSDDPPQLYVSMDGGAHWTPAQLPSVNGTPAQPTYSFGWAGANLFVQTAPSGGHYLTASTNGGAFAWVDQNLTGLPSGATLIAGEVREYGDTVYLMFSAASCQSDPATCLIIARSSDGGASWSHDTPQYAGTAYSGVSGIRIVAGAANAPLIGSPGNCTCSAPPLLRSTDGGATWHALAAFPTGLHTYNEFFTVESADGSVYATLSQPDGGAYGIYLLAPGATSWRLIGSPTGDQYWAIESATWDANGHPTAIWGWAWANDSSEGIWRHMP